MLCAPAAPNEATREAVRVDYTYALVTAAGRSNGVGVSINAAGRAEFSTSQGPAASTHYDEDADIEMNAGIVDGFRHQTSLTGGGGRDSRAVTLTSHIVSCTQSRHDSAMTVKGRSGKDT